MAQYMVLRVGESNGVGWALHRAPVWLCHHSILICVAVLVGIKDQNCLKGFIVNDYCIFGVVDMLDWYKGILSLGVELGWSVLLCVWVCSDYLLMLMGVWLAPVTLSSYIHRGACELGLHLRFFHGCLCFPDIMICFKIYVSNTDWILHWSLHVVHKEYCHCGEIVCMVCL